MWYKHFNKQSWSLRVWRKSNLKFLADDYGMMKFKNLYRWKDFIFRLSRTEGTLRAATFFIGLGAIPIFVMLKSQYYDPVYIAPKKELSDKMLKEKDDEAKAILFYNRFGAPSRPLRSLDDMIAFLGGSETYNDLADFTSYSQATKVNSDQQLGLDSWMGKDDAKMMQYYKESLKSGGHH